MSEVDYFEQLNQTVSKNGPTAAAKSLVDKMRGEKRYPELFEALKMLHRLELGLPAVQVEALTPEQTIPVIAPDVQDELDKRLIEACREVGDGLIRQGKVQEGWMYMRAVGDNQAASDALATIEPTQENLDLLLNLYVHEGVNVGRGTELCLRLRGTCNTITMMDSVIAMRGRADQQAAVGKLVEHVHKELLQNVIADLSRREPSVPPVSRDSIVELLNSKPGILRDGTYHLDTTHLASTVRFAKVLDNPEQIRLAVELAEYGRQLHAQYQYESEEPFADLYPMSLAWFRALLGEQVDAALRLFRQKAEALDPNEHGTVAIETYADLLARVNRPEEATRFLIKAMPTGMRPFGIAPSLIELAQASGDFRPMLEHARMRRDLIGFSAALLQSTYRHT